MILNDCLFSCHKYKALQFFYLIWCVIELSTFFLQNASIIYFWDLCLRKSLWSWKILLHIHGYSCYILRRYLISNKFWFTNQRKVLRDIFARIVIHYTRICMWQKNLPYGFWKAQSENYGDSILFSGGSNIIFLVQIFCKLLRKSLMWRTKGRESESKKKWKNSWSNSKRQQIEGEHWSILEKSFWIDHDLDYYGMKQKVLSSSKKSS